MPTLLKDHEATGFARSGADRRFEMSLDAALRGGSIKLTPDDARANALLRVLIVDDHRASADTLFRLAEIWGHDVRRAYDGVTGLALAAAFQPDVLLLDIIMPDLNGLEVAMQVRHQARLKDCFIIALTGRTDAKHRQQCYESGVDLFLDKPVAATDMQTLLMLELQYVLSRRIDNSRRSALVAQ